MKKILWIFAFSMLILNAQEQVKQTDTKTLAKLIKDDLEDFFILDIREPDQVGHGEIFHMNLVTITRGYLEFKIENQIPNKDAKIIVYCCTGKRGDLAAKTLKEMGYKNTSSLKGGIRQWVTDGYPLDTVYGEVFLK